MNTYFVRKSGRQSDLGRDIENVNRCVWCTVPDSWFLYSLPTLRVDRKRLYMYKKGPFGGFRPHLLKINTAVYEDIKCQF